MTLYVLATGFITQVLRDLQTICPDPGLSVADNGEVQLTQTMTSVGIDTVALLVSHSGWVGMRGEAETFSVSPQPDQELEKTGGVTIWDQYPGTQTVEIVYDASDCGGRKHWVKDSSGNRIPYPTDVSLFHEMGHAMQLLTGTVGATASDDYGAIAIENRYRDSRGLTRRKELGASAHEGGCNSAAMAAMMDPKKQDDCFVATAAFGSAAEPEVDFLRRFRDEALLQTRIGRELVSRYIRVGPVMAEWMHRDSQLREAVRWGIVTPAIHQLRLLLTCPDSATDDLREPWRSYIQILQTQLSQWTEQLPVPVRFDGLPGSMAALELETVLRYLMRSSGKRKDYLDRLARENQLPLEVAAEDRLTVTSRLRSAGCSEDDVMRILGPVPAPHAKGRGLNIAYGYGPDHSISKASIKESEWIYTVTIVNGTSDIFDDIIFFYDRLDMPTGVVFLAESNVLPGQVRVFKLCVCNKLDSYAFSFYQNDAEVLRFPETGVMTPALASQIHPEDVEPCADSWIIGSN